MSILWDKQTPVLGLLVISHLVFKARAGRLIQSWQRCMCYTFPEMYL